MRHVQVAVIGAGSAGLTAYREARRHSDAVVLIDPGPLGTTCARVGCMPSKLLIAAADTAWHARHADTFGIQIPDIRVDGQAVMTRVRQMRDRFVAKVLEGMTSIPAADRIEATVHFASDHELHTSDGQRLHAERIVIATGSRPSIPGFLRAAGDRLIVNDDLFEWTRLPTSVAVFGPGVIGLELGQALSRLGVRVRMFGVGGALGPIEDTDVRKAAHDSFSAEFPLDADASVNAIHPSGQQVEVTFIGADGSPITECFDYLLAATGRRPNVDGLALENTTLKCDARGLPLFDPHTLQCSVPHIFIAGDANNHLPLLHEAADEGAIAGRNAACLPDITPGHRTTPLAIVFTDPQIATVGARPADIEQQYPGRFAVAHFRFSDQARAKVLARDKGLMKVWAECGSGRVLGAELLGTDVEHLAHLLAWSIEQQLSVDQLLAMPYYHPVIEEGLRSLLRSLKAKL
ncbi:dihydrolipoyl dehydrogenase [Marinobacterium weihaiense]|uniref:Dihydrolipoyl dehydrogenase n=1 Tax=Marinobacterium weihaiense TaxID=2851016 RepID=A0ABS6M8S4_9GAMM|nr:dihydrolipoyl dehydrogenase [Marinobacterium weihaiense]MBV0932686.1 dihydrolipoyl dehydrogenase [Marinobacterium weihaiense]